VDQAIAGAAFQNSISALHCFAYQVCRIKRSLALLTSYADQAVAGATDPLPGLSDQAVTGAPVPLTRYQVCRLELSLAPRCR
jgi:hypothetical protein